MLNLLGSLIYDNIHNLYVLYAKSWFEVLNNTVLKYSTWVNLLLSVILSIAVNVSDQSFKKLHEKKLIQCRPLVVETSQHKARLQSSSLVDVAVGYTVHNLIVNVSLNGLVCVVCFLAVNTACKHLHGTESGCACVGRSAQILLLHI